MLENYFYQVCNLIYCHIQCTGWVCAGDRCRTWTTCCAWGLLYCLQKILLTPHAASLLFKIFQYTTLSQDLATMVHEQGDIVDSIESNIESTSVQVTTGAEQLRQVWLILFGCISHTCASVQASVYQNKARRKKIIVAVIGLVILGRNSDSVYKLFIFLPFQPSW